MDEPELSKGILQFLSQLEGTLPNAPEQPVASRKGLTHVPPEVDRAIFEQTRGIDDEYLPRKVTEACESHPELEVIPGRTIGSKGAVLICLVNGDLGWIRTRPLSLQPEIWAEQALETFRLEDRLTLDWRPISQVDLGFVVEPKFREFDSLIGQNPFGRLHQIESRIAISLGLNEFHVQI